MSVATSYLLSLYSDTAHKTPAPPTMWGGTGGIVAQVRRHMKVAQGSSGSVRKIIEHAYLCWCEGEAYTGEQDPAGGHNKLIQRGSVEERIATNAIENRLGYTVATELVNIYRVHEGKPPVGRSAVYSAILRLIDAGVGRTVRPKKRKQGDTDPNSKWAQASFAWVAQLLIKLGQLTPEQAMRDVLDGGKKAPWWTNEAPGDTLPPYFDPQFLDKLSIHQILMCDEKHRECKFRNGDNRRSCPHLVIFKRDESGEISEGGAFEEVPESLSVKYPKEVRFMQGYAAVKPVDDTGVEGPVEGRRSKPCFYSTKQMISRRETERYEKQENDRVRAQGPAAEDKRRGGWIKTNRAEGQLFEEDGVGRMQNVGPQKVEALRQQNIVTVKDLAIAAPTHIEHDGRTVIGIKPMEKLISAAKDASPGAEDVDKLWDKPNPYEARYGEHWRREIWKCPLLNHYMPIDFMITHLIEDGNRVFKDTKYEKNWVFYHDALKIMIDKTTVQWMREQKDEHGVTYYERWLLPEMGLNYKAGPGHGIPYLPGNHPEWNTCDTSCFWYGDLACDRHVCLSRAAAPGAQDTDDGSWSMATPDMATRLYERILDPFTGVAPTSDEIVKDTKQWGRPKDSTLWIVYRAKGTMVKDEEINASRRCRHGVRASAGSGRGHGGRREKNAEALRLMPVHRDLAGVHQRIIARSVSDFPIIPSSPDNSDSD